MLPCRELPEVLFEVSHQLNMLLYLVFNLHQINMFLSHFKLSLALFWLNNVEMRGDMDRHTVNLKRLSKLYYIVVL